MTRHVVEMWGCSICGFEDEFAAATPGDTYKAVCMAGWYSDNGVDTCPACARKQRDTRQSNALLLAKGLPRRRNGTAHE